MPNLLTRLTPADRLRLLAFDAELRRVPRPLIAAPWAGVDALEAHPLIVVAVPPVRPHHRVSR